jgi:hypothetical protein|tara:strand:- start:810 stop:1136 length:327 start_codon:yes stop_codon:yes gene_type:complete
MAKKGTREFTQIEAEEIYITAYSNCRFPWETILSGTLLEYMKLIETAKCCQLELMMGNLIAQVASIIPPSCGVINMSLARQSIAYKQSLNTFTLNIGLPGKTLIVKIA